MKTAITLITSILVLWSCSRDGQKPPRALALEVVEARGYTIPKDSTAEPKTIPAEVRIVPAGKPRVVLTSSNMHPAGIPKVVIAGVPRVCTPGQDSFSLPKSVPAIHQPFIAGIPEVVLAKEAFTEKQNPQNFSSFGKLQGLKSSDILCMVEDKSGNLWFGTNGAGATKYDGKNFTHFTVKQGLGDNIVMSILQDQDGSMWFGTLGLGVSKYDGKSFTHFTQKEGLSNNAVWSIYNDKAGNLWVGTPTGLSKYDGRSFTNFTVKEGLVHNGVTNILEDESGHLWFGTVGGLCRFDGKSFTHFTEKEGVSNNLIWGMYKDKQGDLWFGTRGGGVNKFDGKKFTHFTDKEGLGCDYISSILQDKDGNFWFGLGIGGVSKYDGKNFTVFSKKEGLSGNVLNCILEDKRGNIWLGTEGGGASKYDGKRFTHFTEQEGLSFHIVTNIREDKRGNLWFGTWNGLNKFDGKSFMQFTTKQGFHTNAIESMLLDESDNLWVGDWDGVSRYDGKSVTHFPKQEGLSNDVLSILQDKEGNIWFGTYMGGVSRYDGKSFTRFTEKEGLSNNIVYCILEDKNGHFWFGTAGGINRYDGKNFTHFTKKEGLKDNKVRSLLEDKSGGLWIGSLNEGVCRYDGKSFTYYTEKEGLSNNDIRSILEDKSGNLWFGTAVGFSKLEKDKFPLFAKDETPSLSQDPGPLFKTYTYEDGFSGIDVNHCGKPMHEARDGTIWISAGDRLTAFKPGEETPDTIAPNIQVTGIALFNENIAWQNLLSYPKENAMMRAGNDTAIVLGNGVVIHDYHFNDISKWYGVPQHLSLAYDNNSVTFQFVGITIQSPKKVRYKFKLEGLDENWSALTDHSEAPYGNLPHGKYTFRVKAMNGDGYWSQEFHYSFTIRPPWWHTWWAYTLFALLFAGFIYALFRYRLNKLRTQHEIVVQKQKASELEMQALRAQMNPHFIFNSLNAINMFILENNKLQASEYLAKFSKLVRLILQNSQEAFIALEKELEALRLYLDLESLRFEEKFLYTISVDDEVDTAVLKVPPLIIQPYAENAIWHGLMHKKERGHLEIRLYRSENMLYCKIIDDGIGRQKAAELKNKSKSENKSMGMRITANRIARLQKNQNEVSILISDLILPDGNAGGTEVLLKIPVVS